MFENRLLNFKERHELSALTVAILFCLSIFCLFYLLAIFSNFSVLDSTIHPFFEVNQSYLYFCVAILLSYLLFRVWPQERGEVREKARLEQSVLVKLMTDPAIINGDVDQSAKMVCEAAVKALGIQRASIWLLQNNGQELVCINLYQSESNEHSSGTILRSEDYPRYFQALYSGRVVEAEDAKKDPRTSEFTEHYLEKYQIVSMLDAAIRLRGKVIGVVCNESVSEFRRWSTEEISFAAEMADQMTLAFINQERKEADDALKYSEQMFRQLTENIREVFWLSSTDKKIVYYISPAFEEVWGRSCRDHYNDPLAWLASVHKDDLAHVKKFLPDQISGHYDIEFRILRPDNSIRWIRDRAFPIRNEDGEIYRIAGIAEDITEKKYAEERRSEIEDQLQQSQKMEALGELAGGIAHDFNNILGSIIGYSELLRDQLTKDPTLSSKVEIVLSGAYRAKDLIRQILTYTRQTETEFEVVKIGDVIEEVIRLMKVSLPDNIFLKLDIKSDCKVLADQNQIYQVYMNLCANAVYAMRERQGEILITLDVHKDHRVNKYFARVTVKDQGHGIPDHVLDKIFDPFFTTKPIGEGTGLGLSVVQGVVNNHGGMISVTSELDIGTTFEVLLPLAQPEAIKEDLMDEMTLEIAETKGTEKIIFVDDEEMVTSLGKDVLEQNGYQVASFTDPKIACEFIIANADYSLLVTDLAMPSMSGEELARRVKKIRPDLKIILCTGYDPGSSLSNGSEAMIDAKLSKPFSIVDFLKTVRGVLDSGSSINL